MRGEKGIGHAFRSKIRNLVTKNILTKLTQNWNKTSELQPGGSAKREHDIAPDHFREERPTQQIGGEEEGWWKRSIIPVVANISRWFKVVQGGPRWFKVVQGP